MQNVIGDKATYTRAVSLFTQKRLKESCELFESLPESPIVLYNIATCCRELGDLFKAERIYARLVKSKIRDATLRENIRNCYIATVTLIVKACTEGCQYARALEINEKSLKHIPGQPVLLYNMGHLLKCVGRHKEALHYLEQSLDENPLYFDAYIEQINIYNDAKQYDKAIDIIHKGMDAIPSDARFYNELGVALCRQGKVKEGFDAYQGGLQLPTCTAICAAKIHTNVGNAYSHIGDIPLSLEHSRKAFELDPTNSVAIQNYLMNSLYVCDAPFTETLKQHFQLGALIAKQFSTNFKPYEGPRNPKIRIGYVSGDFFGDHPMTYFLRALLELYDRERFEIYGYCCQQIPPEKGRQYSTDIVWRDIKYMSTANACHVITADRIDVLIDLSGHTSGNRLDIFSSRLAKVQLSYLGYPCITGMPDIDHYIIDETFGWGSKMKMLSMPHCFTHYWPTRIPAADSLVSAYHKKGYISFGTLNKTAKINQMMVDMWDNLLDEFPEARLCLRQNYVFKFRNQRRVVYLEHSPDYEGHMARYNEFDIAFDTAPYSGTTTTCEALIMGVPVITLADRKRKTVHQNVSASLLINSGMSELVLESLEDCKRVIRDLIGQIAADKGFKTSIQSKFVRGNVMNAAQYMADFETLISSLHNTAK